MALQSFGIFGQIFVDLRGMVPQNCQYLENYLSHRLRFGLILFTKERAFVMHVQKVNMKAFSQFQTRVFVKTAILDLGRYDRPNGRDHHF